MGDHAARIFDDERRLNLVEEAAPVTGMMQCRPAGLSVADLKDRDMHIPDYAARFGPHFTEPDNPQNDFAIIDFEYTGTTDSVLYLAHELGHAIADDLQRACGRTFRDYTPDELEKQAYFIQSIVAQSVDPSFNRDSATRPEGEGAIIKSQFNRASQRHDAHNAFESARELEGAARHEYIREHLGGAAAGARSLPQVDPALQKLS